MDKKKLGSTLLSFIIGLSAVPLCGMPVLADNSGTCGDNLTWSLDGGTLTISGTGDMTDFAYRASPWYSYNSGINNVIIEDGVTSIGNYAFYECSLSSVTIADSTTRIGYNSFAYCYSLIEVNMSAKSSQLTIIDDHAFDSCTNLAEFTFPSRLTTIGTGVWDSNFFDSFITCEKLTDIYCYADPAALTWNDPDGDDFSSNTICHVKSSDLNAFTGKFGDVHVTFIGDLDKGGSCGDNLTWTLNSAGVLTISGTGEMYDFYSGAPWNSFLSDIKEIVIESGTTYIGACSFMGCSSAESVSIPDTVETIEDCAFDGCVSLETVTIPESVTEIGPDSFWGCTGVTAVYCYPNPANLEWDEMAPNDFDPDNPITCYVLPSYLQAYINKYNGCVNVEFAAMTIASGNCGAEGDNLTWTLDGDYNLTISGSGAMQEFQSADSVPWYNYSGNIKSVVIENGATSIENYAFYGCSSLSSVTVPNSITKIGNCAFYLCRNLNSVTIPSAVTSIGEYAFYYCNIESIDIPSGVTTIEPYTFFNCTNLISATLPAGLTSIGSFAFSATALTSITIPGSVTNISNEAFRDCEALEDVYCYAKPSTLSWGDTADTNDFMSSGETACHVPYNYRIEYREKFALVNVIFVGNLDSIFENGLCELTGYSLSLEGDIGVKFYMDLAADVVNNPDAKMLFAVPADGDTEGYEVYVNPQADASKPHAEAITVEGHTIYVFKCSVAAKEMTSTIVTKLISGSAESEKYSYSVKQYADYILANPSTFQKEQELVKSMLVYGGYAQVYFGHNTDNLAYDGLDAADIDAIQNVTAATIEKYAYDGTTDFSGITFTGVNLELKSELVMNLRFKNVPDGTVFKVGDQELAVRTSGSTTIVVYDKITAKNISSSVPVTIYNGTTVLGTVTYNPMTYCYNVLNRELSASRTQELKNVVAALYLYNYSASNYIPA